MTWRKRLALYLGVALATFTARVAIEVYRIYVREELRKVPS